MQILTLIWTLEVGLVIHWSHLRNCVCSGINLAWFEEHCLELVLCSWTIVEGVHITNKYSRACNQFCIASLMQEWSGEDKPSCHSPLCIPVHWNQTPLQHLQKLGSCPHSGECIEPPGSLAADQSATCSARLGCSLGPLTGFWVRPHVNSNPKKCSDFKKRFFVFLKCMLVSVFRSGKSQINKMP